MSQFTKSGRRIAGWTVVAAIAFSGYLFVANMPEPERTHWLLSAAFMVALCIALESRSQVRELQKRVNLLERQRR